jgi:hypothetical protein
LNQTLSHKDSEEIGKGINAVSNERLNGYELGFGLGLSPNGSDERLLGRILANGLVEQVRTRWLDRPAAAGLLGLGGLGWAARNVGKAGRLAGFQPKSRFQIRNYFSFSNLFYKLQIKFEFQLLLLAQ